MNTLIVVGAGAVLLLLATRFYGRWIGRVFDLQEGRTTPAEAAADGRDFVASPRQVVFAHHFASIAGAGPIVGPIIALAFGWGPAWLWIVIGGIFFGAVHDMTALCVSLREGGRTIAEVARRTLGRGGFLLLVTFLIIVLSLVNAIFLNLSAKSLTTVLPVATLGVDAADTVLKTVETDAGAGDGTTVTSVLIGGIATTSVFVMTLLAPLLGWLIVRGRLRGPAALLSATAICTVAVIIGFMLPIRLDPDPAVAANHWRWMLSAYVFVGCWVPVWLILQPRDFCNVQILYAGIALLVVGMIVGGLQGESLEMERANTIADGATRLGPVWPGLMITIACGAISGFHCLVASGTTVKQIRCETDCRRIGYGAMMLESLLALLVLVTVASRLTGAEYQTLMMPEGAAGNPIITFALAAGRSFAGLGIPVDVGTVLGILIIEGFLVTTLDTAVRLGRYLFEELWGGLFGDRTPRLLRNTLFNTALAVALMLLIAFSSVYDAVWQIFGAGNQLIGAMALTTVSVYLIQHHRAWLFAAVPAAIMTVTTITALVQRTRSELAGENLVMAVTAALLTGLAVAFVGIALVRVRAAIRAAAPTT
ncbi:MAG: carbon starvation protein A [Phycisphaerales bacterium]